MPATGTNKAAVLSHCGLLSGALVPGIKAVGALNNGSGREASFQHPGKEEVAIKGGSPDSRQICDVP